MASPSGRFIWAPRLDEERSRPWAKKTGHRAPAGLLAQPGVGVVEGSIELLDLAEDLIGDLLLAVTSRVGTAANTIGSP